MAGDINIGESNDFVLKDNIVSGDININSDMQWISVKDRLPNINKPILMYGENIGIIEPANYDKDFDGDPIFTDEYGTEYFGVTHWMPLPEPPKV